MVVCAAVIVPGCVVTFVKFCVHVGASQSVVFAVDGVVADTSNRSQSPACRPAPVDEIAVTTFPEVDVVHGPPAEEVVLAPVRVYPAGTLTFAYVMFGSVAPLVFSTRSVNFSGVLMSEKFGSRSTRTEAASSNVMCARTALEAPSASIT